MSNRVVLEFDRNYCPTTNVGSVSMFGQGIAEYLRTGDPNYLPPGVTVVAEEESVPVGARTSHANSDVR